MHRRSSFIMIGGWDAPPLEVVLSSLAQDRSHRHTVIFQPVLATVVLLMLITSSSSEERAAKVRNTSKYNYIFLHINTSKY